MKTKQIVRIAVAIVALGLAPHLRADEPAKPSADLKAKLEEITKLPPEERRVKMREFVQGLTPEQRQELRKLRQASQPSAEQLETQRKRMAERLAALEKKKADGTITEQETKQLERLKNAQQRIKDGEAKRPEAGAKKKADEKPAKAGKKKKKSEQ